jgi:DNA-binding response OmpR family regulator
MSSITEVSGARVIRSPYSGYENESESQEARDGVPPRHSGMRYLADEGKAGSDVFRAQHALAVAVELIHSRISGQELRRTMKRLVSGVPVMVSSTITELGDEIFLLEVGGHESPTKPFSRRERTGPVQAAIVRRRPPERPETYQFGECEINFETMTAKRGGVRVLLTAHEFKLLRFFTENPERVLSRELLLNRVWGYNTYPTTRTVDNQILKLRQKLEGDPANPAHLLTIYGAGYKFVPSGCSG